MLRCRAGARPARKGCSRRCSAPSASLAPQAAGGDLISCDALSAAFASSVEAGATAGDARAAELRVAAACLQRCASDDAGARSPRTGAFSRALGEAHLAAWRARRGQRPRAVDRSRARVGPALKSLDNAADPAAWRNLAAAQMHAGAYREAAKTLGGLVERFGARLRPRLMLDVSALFAQLGEWPQALSYLRLIVDNAEHDDPRIDGLEPAHFVFLLARLQERAAADLPVRGDATAAAAEAYAEAHALLSGADKRGGRAALAAWRGDWRTWSELGDACMAATSPLFARDLSPRPCASRSRRRG